MHRKYGINITGLQRMLFFTVLLARALWWVGPARQDWSSNQHHLDALPVKLNMNRAWPS